MSNRNDYSKKILKILAKKPAVSMREISDTLDCDYIESQKVRYAITRSIKNMEDSGLIERVSSGQSDFARITKDGRKKAHSLNLDSPNSLVSTSWDGYWRIIMLDIPEERKNERESLRYLLKKAGFVCIKNSMWVSMLPYEHLFINIKNDLDLTTELMIMVTDKIDPSTESALLHTFGFKN